MPENRAEIYRHALALQDERDDLKKLYTHAKKRLFDEFSIDLDREWETRVVAGEHDVPFPDTTDLEYSKMHRALRNIRMLVARMVNRTNRGGVNATLLVEELGHIMRFCAEGGETGSVLRADQVPMNTMSAEQTGRLRSKESNLPPTPDAL